MRHLYFIGLRGFPGVQGGIETHVENLISNLPPNRFRIICFGRRRFKQKHNYRANFNWVWLWAPSLPGFETFIHTLLCTGYLVFCKRGIAHLHGIGPGALSLLLRIIGFRVVFTHHGYDYERAKWGMLASFILRTSQRLAITFSHETIAVSRNVAVDLRKTFRRSVHYIPNGTPSLKYTSNYQDVFVKELSLPFFLMAARFVPEKRIEDGIEAFLRFNKPDCQLVIAGSSDAWHKDLDKRLLKMAKHSDAIIFLGHIPKTVLWQYMRCCLAFINASSHEGLPFTVLEAAAHDAKLILSDIPAHREFELPEEAYFKVGDHPALSGLLKKVAESEVSTSNWKISKNKATEYSWKTIANKTSQVYFL